jgi:drug/metabolite transporter (DMT)-like permease
MRNHLLLIAAAALFSTGGAVIKIANLTQWQIASFRSAVAAVALLIALPDARRGWSLRLLPVSAAYAATLILFVLSTRLTTAANAIFLQSTAPLYLLLLGPFILGESLRLADLLFAATVAMGMALFFVDAQYATGIAPDPRLGNILGAASGLTWALTMIGLRWTGRKGEGNTTLSAVAIGNVVATAVTLPMALPMAFPGTKDVAVILYLGVAQIGLAYVCLSHAIRHVPVFEATTVLLLEPVLNPVWAWLVHGERPGTGALIGGALILTATFANTWRQTKDGRSKKV